MRTPGRCTNLEGCWLSASQRDVWVPVGQDFVCSNCGGMLSAPPVRARSFGVAKRAAVLGALATISLGAVAAGAGKLPGMPWLGRSASLQIASNGHGSSAGARAGNGSTSAYPTDESGADIRPPTLSPDGMSLEAARNQPNSPFAMVLGSTGATRAAKLRATHGVLLSDPRPVAARAAAANAGPLVIYTSDRGSAAPVVEVRARPVATTRESLIREEQREDAAISAMHAPLLTLLSHTSLTPHATMQRPVVVPITFGRPPAPETDGEPVGARWRHRNVAKARTGFLPGPAAPSGQAANVDAIAQSVRSAL